MHSEVDQHARLRSEFLWRVSKCALLDRDLEWISSRRAQLRRISLEQIFPSLRYCWDTFIPNCEKLAELVPELGALAELAAHYSTHFATATDRAIASQDEMVEALAHREVRGLALKGAAMRWLCPRRAATNDFDILVPDLDEAWQVIAVGEAEGYVLDRLKLIATRTVRSTPRFVGYGNLYRCDRPFASWRSQSEWDLGLVRTLDLHIGRYTTLGLSYLEDDLWEGAQPWGGAKAVSIAMPSTENMVVIELAHMVRHGTLTIRSINRLYDLLTSKGSELDEAGLRRKLEASHLLVVAKATTEVLRNEFPGPAVGVDVLGAACDRRGLIVPLLARGLTRRHRVERYGASNRRTALAQAHHHGHMSVRQYGLARGVTRSVAGGVRLLASRRLHPRAHRRWDRFRLPWPGVQRDVMLRKVVARAGPGSHLLGSSIERIGRGSVLFESPIGLLASCSYDGRPYVGTPIEGSP